MITVPLRIKLSTVFRTKVVFFLLFLELIGCVNSRVIGVSFGTYRLPLGIVPIVIDCGDKTF